MLQLLFMYWSQNVVGMKVLKLLTVKLHIQISVVMVCLHHSKTSISVSALYLFIYWQFIWRRSSLYSYYVTYIVCRGTQWHSWLRHCATNRQVAGSITDSVVGILH